MKEALSIETERMDDILLLLMHMQRMHLATLLDKHFPTHGLRKGLTMYRIVIGLERRGFVKRNRKTDDKKSFYLSLSPSGIQILRQAEPILKAEQDVLKKQFEPQELDALYVLLQRFEATFKKRNNEGGRTNEA